MCGANFPPGLPEPVVCLAPDDRSQPGGERQGGGRTQASLRTWRCGLRAREDNRLAAITGICVIAVFLVLTFVGWRRYVWAAQNMAPGQADTCQYSLTDVFGPDLLNAPHQKGVRWLTEVFNRSAKQFPHHLAANGDRRCDQSAGWLFHQHRRSLWQCGAAI